MPGPQIADPAELPLITDSGKPDSAERIKKPVTVSVRGIRLYGDHYGESNTKEHYESV